MEKILMDAKIRKNRDILSISGKALILFGIWSIVRLFLFKILDSEVLASVLLFPETELLDAAFIESAFDITIIVLVINLLLRIFIGASAIAEGSGRKKSIFYIVLAIIYIIYSLISDILVIINPIYDKTSIAVISPLIIDFSSCFALIMIVIASFSCRKLIKEAQPDPSV